MNKKLLGGLRIVFWIHLVVGIIFGVGLLVFANTMLQLYKYPGTDTFFVRCLGAAILGFTTTSWLALQANDWDKVRIVVIGEIVWAFFYALVGLYAMVIWKLPAMGWINVVLMAFFAGAFGYYYFQQERLAAPQVRPATRPRVS